MASLPANITWGPVVSGSGDHASSQGKIGIGYTTTESATQLVVNLEVWFWSRYSIDDTNNKFYFDGGSASATTLIGKVVIDHTVNSSWNTSNQTKLYSDSVTLPKYSSKSTYSFAAKFTGIEVLGRSNAMNHYVTVEVPAISTYTITYNANNGTLKHASTQTKQHDVGISILGLTSSTAPTRTGYTFKGWSTSPTATSATYLYGSTYTYSTNANLPLYAVWSKITFTITYHGGNASSVSGIPSPQTKKYGENLTLHTSVPTRPNHTFKGWSTSQNGSVVYLPGGTYSVNSSADLYAVWELSYTPPRVYGLSAARCDANANSDDTGVYNKITFSWKTDLNATKYEIVWKYPANDWSNAFDTYSETLSGREGTINLNYPKPIFSAESVYDVKVTVFDSNSDTSAFTTLASAKFIIDFKAGGDGIAFGKAATIADTAEFGFAAKFNKPVTGKALGMDTVTRIPAESDIDDYLDPGCYAVYTDIDAAGMTNLPSNHAGRVEVWSATGSAIEPDEWAYIRQVYRPYNLEKCPTMERDIMRYDDNTWRYKEWYYTKIPCQILYSNDSGSNGTITLSKSLTEFHHVEIFFSDNNGYTRGSIKFNNLKNKKNYIDLALTESAYSTLTQIRRTRYTLTIGTDTTTIAPDLTKAGYAYLLSGSTVDHKSADTNFIYITEIIGYYM